jgi:hypothetical protein
MKKLYTLLIALSSFICYGQDELEQQIPEHVTEYILSMQKTLIRDDTLKKVFWFPTEYWNVVSKVHTQYDSNAVKQLEDIVKDYIIIAVADGVFDPDSSIFKSEKDLKKEVRLIDNNKKIHLPLSEIKIPKLLTFTMNQAKPGLEEIEFFGKGFHFLYFKVKDENGKDIINSTQKGGFIISLSNTDFKWDLPLSFDERKKKCPKDNTAMKTEWIYCPVHGIKL